MRAYKNDNGLVDIFYNEPDETITIEEFEARKAERERQRKIEEHLAALRELGYVFETATDTPTEAEKVEAPAVAEAVEAAVPVSVPAHTAAPVRAKRW